MVGHHTDYVTNDVKSVLGDSFFNFMKQ